MSARPDTHGLATDALIGSRYKRVLPYLQGDVLEIGAGSSPVAVDPPPAVRSYAACDVDATAVERFRQLNPGCRAAVVDLDSQPFPDEFGPFDTVIAVAVIEHLFNLRLVMQHLVGVLRPGGRIVMTTPTPIGNDLVLPFAAAVGLTSKLAIADHIASLNKRRFGILASEVGLELTHYRRFQAGLNSLAVMERTGGARGSHETRATT